MSEESTLRQLRSRITAQNRQIRYLQERLEESRKMVVQATSLVAWARDELTAAGLVPSSIHVTRLTELENRLSSNPKEVPG